jgi:hypothetical protein
MRLLLLLDQVQHVNTFSSRRGVLAVIETKMSGQFYITSAESSADSQS